MSDSSYGVAGVLPMTKERGHYACASPKEPTADLPAAVPTLPSAATSGIVMRAFAFVGSAVHYVAVVMSLGLYGRQSDGTYFSHLDGYEIHYDALYEA